MKKFKNCLFIATFIFLIGSISGYYSMIYVSKEELKIWQKKSNKIIDILLTEDKQKIFKQIIWNNTIVIIVNLSGIFSLGVISVLCLFFNGLVFGQLIYTTYTFYSQVIIITHILPHSTELIAIILSGSLGIYGGYDLAKFLINQKHIIDFNLYIKIALLCFLIIFFSAIVEVYVSMQD